MIVDSEDAGTYYCAHLNYVLKRYAFQNGHCIHDFLHVPASAFLERKKSTISKGPQKVWVKSPYFNEGMAFLVETLTKLLSTRIDSLLNFVRDESQIRVLITGFGPFREILDNPCSEFLKHQSFRRFAEILKERLLEAHRLRNLQGPRGNRKPEILLSSLALAVDNSALNIDSEKWGNVLSKRPHWIVSLGVQARSSNFELERVADSRAMCTLKNCHRNCRSEQGNFRV